MYEKRKTMKQARLDLLSRYTRRNKTQPRSLCGFVNFKKMKMINLNALVAEFSFASNNYVSTTKVNRLEKQIHKRRLKN